MRMPDHVLGAVLFVASIAYAAMTYQLPGGSWGAYGPKLFPFLIAAGIAASSTLLMLRRFRGKPETGAIDSETENTGRNWLNGAAVCAVVVYAIFLMPVIGFFLTVAPALIALLMLLRVRPWHAAAIGLVATIAIEFAFRTLLHVPLPMAPGSWTLF